jgi:hypothetical protein
MEWSEGWEAPRAVVAEATEEVLALLHQIHEAAARRDLPTAVVITHGASSLSVVLGTGELAFLQWMGGGKGSYLGVDVGDKAGSGVPIAFSYQGHHSEVPCGDFVRRDDALDEVRHFVATGGLSPRWQWSGWHEDDADPGRDARVITPE